MLTSPVVTTAPSGTVQHPPATSTSVPFLKRHPPSDRDSPMPSEITYHQDPDPRPSVVREQDIEEAFTEKLKDLKYTHRPDIRGRASHFIPQS